MDEIIFYNPTFYRLDALPVANKQCQSTEKRTFNSVIAKELKFIFSSCKIQSGKNLDLVQF